MTPKEKAKELLDKFDFIYSYDGLDIMDEKLTNDDRKHCALIAVDEVLDVDCFDMSEEHFDNHIEWWSEVKQEIEKI
jgi:hypothetical protein